MTSYYVRRSGSSLFSDDAMIAGIGAPTRSPPDLWTVIR